MAAPEQNVARRTRELGLTSTDDFGRAIAFATHAQNHRADRDPATPTTITRTTALIGAGRADDEILELGAAAGIDWNQLAEGADLADWSPPVDIAPRSDGIVHERVLEALDAYSEHFAERDVIDALGLAWSLVEAGDGPFLERLREAGGRIDDVRRLWGDALYRRPFAGIDVDPDSSAPVAGSPGPSVWVTAGRPNAQQPVDLEALTIGTEVAWMVPAGVRKGDFVLFWVAGGTGFRYVARALADAEHRSVQGRTAPTADLRVDYLFENPIQYGSLLDDPVLANWGLVRRKMQGAIRAQPASLTDDPDLWAAFADLVVASNPELAQWTREVSAPYGEEQTRIDWISDAAATVDRLHRRPLAEDLARRLDRMVDVETAEEGANTSFLVHLDGPWGSGKSTMLNFLREELDDRGWLVVDFNAWRQSNIGPPWWTLFAALRKTHLNAEPQWRRAKLTIQETWQRIEIGGSLVALVATVVAVLALITYWLAGPGWRWETITDVAASTGAIVSLGGVVIAGTRLVRRYLVWDSAGRAGRLEEIHSDPMGAIRTHLNWYLRRVHKPVAYLIDDLDRCETEYVVELLEAVQTLMRDSHEAASGREQLSVKGPYFVVAADGRWIRSSFEAKFGQFSDYVGEPGRPLGYLFLDKIFQLTVQIPMLSPAWQEEYLRDLLRVRGESDEDLTAEEGELRNLLELAKNDDEVFAATETASPMIQALVTSTVLAKLSEPELEKRRTHALSKFARLLDRNPRSMKRFVNTYSVLQGVRFIEHARVPRDVLALWTIVQIRWPLLAAYLRSEPGSVEQLSAGQTPPDFPGLLAALVGDGQVGEVLSFPAGGPLTAEKIRLCCGTDSG